ncbi:MAG TPA: ArsC/Spx/MgsR family protein, partial [Burkholderiaceae bacterium]
KGTAWRALDDAVRDGVVDAPSAKRVMLANASVIKRPVVEWPDGAITVGFDADDWARR